MPSIPLDNLYPKDDPGFDLDCDLAEIEMQAGDGVFGETHPLWESLQRVKKLAHLGLAAKRGKIYRCDYCNQWKAEPVFTTANKEHVNVDFREISVWKANYCSQACHDTDPKDTQE
jgi:hypothetical protein